MKDWNLPLGLASLCVGGGQGAGSDCGAVRDVGGKVRQGKIGDSKNKYNFI